MTDWPNLNDIKQLRVTKFTFNIEYKVSYDKDKPFKTLDFLQYKIIKSVFLDVPCSVDCDGIPVSKKRRHGKIYMSFYAFQ